MSYRSDNTLAVQRAQVHAEVLIEGERSQVVVRSGQPHPAASAGVGVDEAVLQQRPAHASTADARPQGEHLVLRPARHNHSQAPHAVWSDGSESRLRGGQPPARPAVCRTSTRGSAITTPAATSGTA